MKNQYVGDINDYFKYSILRALASRSNRPLAICWMLTDDDASTDGSLTAYLDRPGKFRELDPGLFDGLKAVLATGRRDVATIESKGLIPCAAYVSGLLYDQATARAAYFADLWSGLPDRTLLFFDPDNGLEVSSVPKGRRGSRRYLYFDELHQAIELGHVAVVYQHFPRVQRSVFVTKLMESLRDRIPQAEAIAIYSSRVAYLVVGEDQELRHLSEALHEIADRWDGGLRVSVPQARLQGEAL
jgi:hypothetical protein